MQKLSETERVASAGALVVLVFIILITSVIHVGKLFTEPFDLPLAEQPDETSEADKERENLIKKDTDSDGLNDYDELYVYNTSPYLSDTDSDGINDKVEIENGGDPNCPEGKDCYGSIIDIGGNVPLINSSNSIDRDAIPQEDFDTVREALPENPDPEDIREILREAGFDDLLLNQLTDNELIEAYQQTLNDFGN